MCCLALMSRATTTKWSSPLVIYVAGAWILAAAAITVRRAGVALLPPLVVMMVSSSPHSPRLIRNLCRRAKVILFVISIVGGVGAIGIIAKTSTLSDFTGATSNSTLYVVSVKVLSYRLRELGELFTNCPSSKLPGVFHFLSLCGGLVLLMLMLIGWLSKRRQLGPTETFVISYVAILFAWPYYDARFWLPIMPLLIAYSALAVRNIRLLQPVVTIYCVGFALLGLVAVAYSTRISFAGPEFPDRYGDGNLRPTYCMALHSCGDSGESRKVDAKVLNLLHEYN